MNSDILYAEQPGVHDVLAHFFINDVVALNNYIIKASEASGKDDYETMKLIAEEGLSRKGELKAPPYEVERLEHRKGIAESMLNRKIDPVYLKH